MAIFHVFSNMKLLFNLCLVRIFLWSKKSLYKEQFEIVQYDVEISTSKTATICPDSAVCDKCKVDILKMPINNSSYFVIKCALRYSILQTVPYDRDNSTFHNLRKQGFITPPMNNLNFWCSNFVHKQKQSQEVLIL